MDAYTIIEEWLANRSKVMTHAHVRPYNRQIYFNVGELQFVCDFIDKESLKLKISVHQPDLGRWSECTEFSKSIADPGFFDSLEVHIGSEVTRFVAKRILRKLRSEIDCHIRMVQHGPTLNVCNVPEVDHSRTKRMVLDYCEELGVDVPVYVHSPEATNKYFSFVSKR